jgi:hypothetical protein
VQAKLEANASDVQIKQAGLDALRRQIVEFEDEKRMIEDAQAKFSWYLEENSITVYNNVTLEYLDHQIRDEKAKMGYGDPRRAAIIEALETSKKKHEAFVNAMREGKLAKGSARHQALDANGVERLINALCAMRHFGQQFRDARDAVQNAYLRQFREKPFRVRKAQPYMSRPLTLAGRQSKRRAPSTTWFDGGGPSEPPRGQMLVKSLLSDFPEGSSAEPEITTAEPEWPVQEMSDETGGEKSFPTSLEQHHEVGPPPYTSIGHTPSSNPSKRASLMSFAQKIRRLMSRLKISG